MVEVTEKNIEEARELSRKGHLRSLSCPIALALKEAGYERVSVSERTCVIDGRYFYLPIEAVEFINAFDRGVSVKPFSFKL